MFFHCTLFYHQVNKPRYVANENLAIFLYKLFQTNSCITVEEQHHNTLRFLSNSCIQDFHKKFHLEVLLLFFSASLMILIYVYLLLPCDLYEPFIGKT